MSEEIINPRSSLTTKETNNNINNNDNNIKQTTLKSEQNDRDYDEIGEEFNFSDSDLEDEFEDCSDSNEHSKNNADNDRLTDTTTTEITKVITPKTNTTTACTAVEISVVATTVDIESGKLSDLPVPKTSLDDVMVENVSKTKQQNNINDDHSSAALNPAIGETVNIHAVDIDDDGDDDDYYSDEPEDELIVHFLGEANRIAEARLTARRQARTEAREIRMRELERQQKDKEHNADRAFDRQTTPTHSTPRLVNGRAGSTSSRRSSEDSLEEEKHSFSDPKQELKDAEERFRKAMIANAQMDNERASQSYQIEHLKDQLEEIGELHMQVQRELKEKTKECNALQRNLDKVSEELKLVNGQLSERDTLIADYGLVVVAIENEDGSDAKRTLITAENAQLLSSVQGSLDVRLKRFNEEKLNLRAEIERLTTQLANYKSKDWERANNKAPELSEEESEAQREANKLISDYKFRLQKAEQDIASLQANLARSETQLLRYKNAAEAAEKAEAELKGERRKLQRENREAIERLEELETSNNHLLKRLDKLKNAKSALLKEL